jgi:hypothetical protein
LQEKLNSWDKGKRIQTNLGGYGDLFCFLIEDKKGLFKL